MGGDSTWKCQPRGIRALSQLRVPHGSDIQTVKVAGHVDHYRSDVTTDKLGASTAGRRYYWR